MKATLSYNFDTVNVTIPHAAKIRGGKKFTKTWRVINNGTSTWNPNYHLVYTGRDNEMSGKPIPLDRYVKPTEEAEISVQFVAPKKVGTYTSMWQMADGNGKTFPNSVHVTIVVKS